MSEKRYIYDLSEGDATMRNLLGGKGAGVAEMARVGVPVPDAFTVTTTACVETMNRGGEWPDGLADEINARDANSVVPRIRCWFRCAPAQCFPCPA